MTPYSARSSRAHAREGQPGRRRPFIAGALLFPLAVAPACVVYVHERNPVSSELHAGPKAAFSVVRASDRGPLKKDPSVLGRDGAISGMFDGRSVWLYGDTLIDTGHGFSWQSNTWAWTRDLDATNGIDFSFPESAGEPVPLLRETSAERAFNDSHSGSHCSEPPCGARWALWPQALVTDPSRERALVFYGKVYAEGGFFKFRSAGESVAVWKKFDEPPDRGIDPVTGEPPILFPGGAPAFSNAQVIEADMLYAYGCESNGFVKPCRVARVRLGDVLDSREWTYYAGKMGWIKDSAAAVSVLEANNIMSVAYNRYLGAYLAVYSPPFTNRVMMRTAPRPEGPWSEAVEAFPTRPSMKLWVYDALAHPEYERDGGRIQYVTYSHTTSNTTSEVRLVEVELLRRTPQ